MNQSKSVFLQQPKPHAQPPFPLPVVFPGLKAGPLLPRGTDVNTANATPCNHLLNRSYVSSFLGPGAVFCLVAQCQVRTGINYTKHSTQSTIKNCSRNRVSNQHLCTMLLEHRTHPVFEGINNCYIPLLPVIVGTHLRKNLVPTQAV